MTRLRSDSCGNILRLYRNRQGWYEYQENMMRGFVRLVAESNGVQLATISPPKGKGPMTPPMVRTKGTIGKDIFDDWYRKQKKWL